MTSRYGSVILLLIANLTQYSYLCLYWERLYLFCTDWLTDDNEDNTPFQIDPLGVQAKQLHRVPVPPVDENLFSGTNSETLLSSAQDFFEVTLAGEESAFHFIDVPLAFEESASKLLDVTLAQEDDRLGA